MREESPTSFLLKARDTAFKAVSPEYFENESKLFAPDESARDRIIEKEKRAANAMNRVFFRERLAALCHEQWAGWMKYLFSVVVKNPQTNTEIFAIPGWAVDRWTLQVKTAYTDLSPEEQESDRKEADKFLALINEHRPSQVLAPALAAMTAARDKLVSRFAIHLGCRECPLLARCNTRHENGITCEDGLRAWSETDSPQNTVSPDREGQPT
jgi:hypothetical protein